MFLAARRGLGTEDEQRPAGRPGVPGEPAAQELVY
jgi:hypothetical protein